MQLYAIACTFKLVKDGEEYNGLAICSDPDTPVTFVHSDGIAITEGDDIWNYQLHHHQPWACISN